MRTMRFPAIVSLSLFTASGVMAQRTPTEAEETAIYAIVRHSRAARFAQSAIIAISHPDDAVIAHRIATGAGNLVVIDDVARLRCGTLPPSCSIPAPFQAIFVLGAIDWSTENRATAQLLIRRPSKSDLQRVHSQAWELMMTRADGKWSVASSHLLWES